MSGGDHDTNRMERIAESTGAKFTLRVLVPVVVLVTLPLLTVIYSGMRADVASIRTTTDQHADRLRNVERTMDQLNTKLDSGLTWRIAELERRFTLMEQRADWLDNSHQPARSPN